MGLKATLKAMEKLGRHRQITILVASLLLAAVLLAFLYLPFITEPPFSKESVLHSWSVGTYKPGSEVGLQLAAREGEVELPGPIRVTLILIDDERDVEVVAEKVLDVKTLPTEPLPVTFTLPKKAPARYRLSAVFTDQEGRTLDILTTTLDVPIQELKALMILNREKFLTGDTLVLTIKNEGPTVIDFGQIYWVEYLKDGQWVRADWFTKDKVWIAIAYRVELGGSWSQSVELGVTPLGIYRISKEVRAVGTDLNATLTATFHMVEASQSYGQEALTEVQKEAVEELTKSGLMDKVAILAYDDRRIVLGFYDKIDPEVVRIVKTIIDRRAPGLPLDIVENVEVILQ